MATLAAPSLPAPGSRRAWILAARPATLSAAIVPVAVGTAVAHAAGGVAWGPALAALFGSMCIQIGTNFANDVFDHEKGADTEERLGPPRAAALGLLSGHQLYAGIAVVFGLAFLAGVYLTTIAGWPVVAIGIASLLSGLAYTGGPYPLGYHGLGDVFVMAFFGFVAVCGTVFVQLGHVPELAWWASVPVGALATAILVVNNVRDRDTDVGAGKRTLAVRFGRGGALGEYVALVVLAYAVPVVLVVTGKAHVWALLPLATLPVAAVRVRALFAAVGKAHNPVLVGTAKLLVLFGALFTLGLWL
jgi:1,4-dihydroxy-2-naphthoate octaprenyltransferase